MSDEKRPYTKWVEGELMAAQQEIERLRELIVSLADEAISYLDLEADGQKNWPDSLRSNAEDAKFLARPQQGIRP